MLSEIIEGLASQGWGDGWILKIAYFLENYIGTDNWQCCYIPGRCSYVCCTKQGIRAHVVRGINGTTGCIMM